MRRVRALSACLVGMMALATIAEAQETGTLLPHRAAQTPGRGPIAARVTLEGYAACIVDRSEGRARKLVDLPVNSADYRTTLKNMYDGVDECISDAQLTMSSRLLRGGMFIALYIRDYKGNAISSFAPEVDSGYRALYGEKVPDDVYTVLAMEQFGECVARADPAQARSLTLSYPGSEQEKNSVTALLPRLSACVPHGETIEFSRTTVKGAVAEGLYRLTRAAKNGGVQVAEGKP